MDGDGLPRMGHEGTEILSNLHAGHNTYTDTDRNTRTHNTRTHWDTHTHTHTTHLQLILGSCIQHHQVFQESAKVGNHTLWSEVGVTCPHQ